MLSNIVTNDLTHVSVPAEDGKSIPLGVQHFHAHHIMPLAVQHLRAQLKPLMGHRYFHTHFNILQLSTNNKTSINRKENRHKF
jgi:hypothetical protein